MKGTFSLQDKAVHGRYEFIIIIHKQNRSKYKRFTRMSKEFQMLENLKI